MLKNKEYYHAKKGENIASKLFIYNIGIEKENEKKYTFLVDFMHAMSIIISVKRKRGKRR